MSEGFEESCFTQLLRMEFERCVYVNVVKMKRDNALLKLNIAELALERKDYTAAYMFLSELYKTIEEDEYQDEYQCEAVDFNILLFSACVSCALAKCYVKAEELLLKVLTQTPNPIIYYTLAIVYLYQLKFAEAQGCLEKITRSSSSLSELELKWPWTDVTIANLEVGEFRNRVFLLSYFIDAVKDLKSSARAIALDERKFTDKFNSTANRYKEVKLNGKRTHIGRFLRHDIYNLIRNSLGGLLSIRLSNLPSEYKDMVRAIHIKVGDYFGLHTSKEAEIKKGKHRLTQTSVKVQNAQTQSHNFKQVQRSTQTEPCAMKNQASEELELSLEQTITKLKNAESSIASLKTKKLELEQKLEKDEEYYMQQKEKWLIKDQQNEFKFTKLQSLIEVLEEKEAKKNYLLMENNQQLSEYTNLLTKTYNSILAMQKKYYKHFIAKCQNNMEMLATLGQTMTENRLITEAEILSSMTNWERVLQQSINMQEKLTDYNKDVCEAILENRISDISSITFALPEEPPCLANQCFPALVMDLSEYQMKQNLKADRTTEEKSIQTQLFFDCPAQANSIDNFKSTNQHLNQVLQTLQAKAVPLSNVTEHSNINCLSNETSTSSQTNIRKYINSPSNNFRKDLNKNSVNEKGGEPVKTSESENSSSKKLFVYIKNKLPSHDESEVMRALNKFREQNNGKLTGLTLHFILYNVRKILGVPQSAWDEIKPQWDWQGNNGETSCSICFALFEEFPVTILKCKHKFHVKCIRKWLVENSVCAICRIHVTMDEDFPPLKH